MNRHEEHTMPDDQHRIPLTVLEQRLNSSRGGLSSDEAARRLAEFGSNELNVRKGTPEYVKFFCQFRNLFALLLIAGSALAFIAEYLQPGDGNVYIGEALILVVALNAVFTYMQERHVERIMESFRTMLPPMATVVRDGRVCRIEARLLVPGDVIQVEEGDRVPADARLTEVNQLKVDHSNITGESEPQLRKLDCTHHYCPVNY